MIPKIIHGFWGGDPMPKYLSDFWNKWNELHPDWDVWLWTPDNRPELVLEQYYQHPHVYSPKSNVWQWRSDLVRYEVLLEYGGVWVDMDLEPLRPIDELCELRGFIARESPKYFNISFVGVEQDSSFINDVVDRIPDRIMSMPKARSNKSIGPHLVTEVMPNHPEITELPSELVYPYLWSDIWDWDGSVHPYAWTAHHWHHKRTLEGVAL